jgi:hypothetical protein
MRSILTVFILLILNISNAQIISVEDLGKSLNKNKTTSFQIIESKGFRPELSSLDKIAKNMAAGLSKRSGKKFSGNAFIHSSNYSATVISDEIGIVSAIQLGTKRPKEGEIKNIESNLIKLGFIKRKDEENDTGSSNIKVYYNKDQVFSLAVYNSGGYTLTAYTKALEL